MSPAAKRMPSVLVIENLVKLVVCSLLQKLRNWGNCITEVSISIFENTGFSLSENLVILIRDNLRKGPQSS